MANNIIKEPPKVAEEVVEHEKKEMQKKIEEVEVTSPSKEDDTPRCVCGLFMAQRVFD